MGSVLGTVLDPLVSQQFRTITVCICFPTCFASGSTSLTSPLSTIITQADKTLMTTLVIALAWRGLLPSAFSRSLTYLSSRMLISWLLLIRQLITYLIIGFVLSAPLAVIILGRDIIFVLAAFYLRWSTLPPPVRRLPPFRHSFSRLRTDSHLLTRLCLLILSGSC